MYRELKIVITIVLVYVIFGLNSLFVNGGFVTPFLYSKIILVATSVIFYFLNYRIKGKVFLVWNILAFISLALVDEFTIGYLDQLFQTNFFNEFTGNEVFIFTAFLIFQGLLFAQLYPFYNDYKNKLWTPVFLFLLILQFVFSIGGFSFYAFITLSAFMLLYFVVNKRINREKKNVLDILSIQFLGLFLLETFKFAV